MQTRTVENMALFATSLLGNYKAFRGGDAPPHECADRRSSLCCCRPRSDTQMASPPGGALQLNLVSRNSHGADSLYQ